MSGIFAYNLLSRIFNLPSELFERGLRWVNGGQEVTGDGQGERETRNNMVGFVHQAKGVNAAGAGVRAMSQRPQPPSPSSPTPAKP